MDRPLSILFVLALLIPAAWAAGSGSPADDFRKEGRRPSAFPEASLTSILDGRFSAGFEDWFGDAQGLRTPLLEARNDLWWTTLGLSPSKDMVRGQDDWIFTTKRGAIPAHRGLLPLGIGELRALQHALERRARFLAERGIALLVVVAPNKHSIYAERLPGHLTRHGPTPLDQFTAHMAENSEVSLHDFRTTLKAEKAFDRPEVGDFTYHPLGTHWTDRGAWAAARALVEQLQTVLGERFPAFRPLPEDGFVPATVGSQGDSVAPRLHLEEHLSQTVWTGVVQPAQARLIEQTDRMRRLVNPAAGLPDAVVIHDSFGHALWPLLAEHFHRSTFLSVRGADDETILSAEPDVVVMVIVERNLTGLPAVWPFADADESRRN